MIDDPIIEEVRRHRLARAAKFNFDIDAIAADARKREAKSGHKVVLPPKRRWRTRHAKTSPSTAKA
jgi:hypothetical protein